MIEVREKAFYYGLKPEEYNESIFPDVITFINQQIDRESEDIKRQWDIMRRQTAHIMNMWTDKNQTIYPEMLIRFAGEDDPNELSDKKISQIMEEYEKIDFTGAEEALKKAGIK